VIQALSDVASWSIGAWCCWLVHGWPGVACFGLGLMASVVLGGVGLRALDLEHPTLR
jgi:hypothetical protein